MKTLITVANSELKKTLFSQEAIQRLKSFSEVDWVPERKAPSSEQLAEMISGYDACITSWGSPKFTQDVLKKADRLKFIGHAAGSVVAVVNEDIFDTDITITSANKPLAKSTAESAVAMMMAGAWNLLGFNRHLVSGGWSNNNVDTVLGLQDQRVGLIGYGEISKHVIKLLSSFHARVSLYSRYCTPEQAAELGVELCSLEELLSSCPIISLHSTWTPDTEGMIGKEQLALIQDGAVFVNTARGAIVDEDALIAELQTGRFSAVLDVYRKEPVDVANPLLHMPNVLCLPHIGGFHRGLKTSFGGFVIDDLYRQMQGAEPFGQVTRTMYKRLTPR